MIRENFRLLLDELLAHTINCYSDRLVTLAVFGSVGRQCQRADSDIDLIIVAEGLSEGRLKRINEFDQVEVALEPSIKNLRDDGIDTRLSPVIKSPREVKSGSLLFLDMIEDSIILFDRGGFLKSFLKDFRTKLDALGARRIRRGNSWHWVLKQDYREGEVFEL